MLLVLQALFKAFSDTALVLELLQTAAPMLNQLVSIIQLQVL